jgi:hypothetical protein
MLPCLIESGTAGAKTSVPELPVAGGGVDGEEPPQAASSAVTQIAAQAFARVVTFMRQVLRRVR